MLNIRTLLPFTAAAVVSFLVSIAARADDVSAAPPTAKYVCGVFLSGRFTYTQAVTLKDDGAYQPSVGDGGRYRYNAASKQIDFDGGSLEGSFGRYEPDNHQLFRLTSKEDAAKTSASQNWRSQVCSPQK